MSEHVPAAPYVAIAMMVLWALTAAYFVVRPHLWAYVRRCWIADAAEIFQRKADLPRRQALGYAASLAETYFDDPADRWPPVEAVREEMSYWAESQ